MSITQAILLLWVCLLLSIPGFGSSTVINLLPAYFTGNGVYTDYDTSTLNSNPAPVCTDCVPQLLPQPGAKLNFTQIMFDHPQVAGAGEYLVEVALDKDGYGFEKPLARHKDSSTAVILSNFEFGQKYVWRYAALNNGKVISWNGPYNFEILKNPFTDSTQFRVRVLENNVSANAGGCIMLDLAGTIIDRTGKIIWFLPWRTDAYVNENMQTIANLKNSDMQFTRAGTLTALNDHKAQEKNLRGDIIWQAPKRNADYHDSLTPGAPYNYHHCFKKLQNGHYMVLDMEYFTLPDSLTLSEHLGSDGKMHKDTAKVIIPYDIIEEFDKAGNLVWSWHARKYFDNLQRPGMLQGNADSSFLKRNRDGHINAFDTDEKNGFVYAGFRNLNREIKIDKKDGSVVCSWGDNMFYQGIENGNGFFLRHHGTTLMHDGTIAIFNNNPNPKPLHGVQPVSSVEIFTQPLPGHSSAIVWKYDIHLDSADNMASVSGNVDELKNGNLLVCMGSVNRVFEITRNKQIVWNALLESYNAVDSAWHKFVLYRAHYTSSLYPCYFSMQTERRVLKSGNVTFSLVIFNNGTEDDSYHIDVKDEVHNYNRQFLTQTLVAGKNISPDLAPENILPVGAVITVQVTSVSNPDFKRVVYLQK